MNKTKCFSAAFAVFFLSMMPLCAQDIEKEFEEFQKQQQNEFAEFKNKADAEFETFLRETWEKYEAFTAIPAPERPEPPKPIEFDKSKPALPPISIKPVKLVEPNVPAPEPGVYVPGKPYTPVVVEEPTVEPDSKLIRTLIKFYGSHFAVEITPIQNFSLKGNSEADVADAWKDLCGRDYEQTLKDCMALRKKENLNDWAYLLFTKELGKYVYGANRTEDIAFLQMFLLNKSGYKVRLAKIDGKLKLLIAPAGTIYTTPYLNISGTKYYVFEPSPGGSMSIYTYKQDFANAKNLVSLQIDRIPAFDMEEFDEALTSSTGAVKVQTKVNKNLINFYRDYPQCDVVLHYKTPMSEELRASLYPSLKAAIEGKSQKEAANILINFVQTAFPYKTDGDQFGFEKPYFPDETFYYPYCDCEDRAMLYSTLVHDLLGLDTVLLDYPDHIASAVRFTEEIPGDYVVLENGEKYLICDPTYIGASIGTCMEQYKEVAPIIIR